MSIENVKTLIRARIAAVAAAKGNPDIQLGMWRECMGYLAGVHACGFITTEEWKKFDEELLVAFTKNI